MSETNQTLPTIEANVRIALANSGNWLGSADTGAIAALLRLSRLIDQLFDMGETKDLPALLARLTSLMDALQLTPKSRQDQDLTSKEDSQNGSDIQEAYLRIVGSKSKDQTGQGRKPGAASSSTGRSSRSTAAPVASKRPK